MICRNGYFGSAEEKKWWDEIPPYRWRKNEKG